MFNLLTKILNKKYRHQFSQVKLTLAPSLLINKLKLLKTKKIFNNKA